MPTLHLPWNHISTYLAFFNLTHLVVTAALCAALLIFCLIFSRLMLAADQGLADAVSIMHCVREAGSALRKVQIRASLFLLIFVLFIFGMYLIPEVVPSGVLLPFAVPATLFAGFTALSIFLSVLCSQLALWLSLRSGTRTAAAIGRSENEALQLALRGGLFACLFTITIAIITVIGCTALLFFIMPLPSTYALLPLMGLPVGAAMSAQLLYTGTGVFSHAARLTVAALPQYIPSLERFEGDELLLYAFYVVSCIG